MDLNEFAKEVHANAIEHGWWGEEYTDAAVIALIHAEISEAFEEWRAGRPMVWHACVLDLMCDGNGCSDGFDPNEECKYRGPEPHGIAVELIDVVLRVLDAAAAWEHTVIVDKYDASFLTLPELASKLHYLVSKAYVHLTVEAQNTALYYLDDAIAYIFAWLHDHDIDPEVLMLEKHEYNKTRPYRHGGKRV